MALKNIGRDNILLGIVERFGQDLAKFKDLAQERYLSWQKHPEYFEYLNIALDKVNGLASSFSREKAQKLLGIVLKTRLFHQSIYESYKTGEFQGALLRGMGQEAVGAGAGTALLPHDVLARDHRSISASIAKGTSLYDIWTNHLMRATSPTGGYDPNLHFMSGENNDIGFSVSDMGMNAVLINGTVWYINAKLTLEEGRELEPSEKSCGLAIIGDGAASNGITHSGINFAKAWGLPVVFVILNNQIALRTPPEEEHGGINLANRAIAYEMPMLTVDGDNVFEVYLASMLFLEFARLSEHPALIHAITFRRCGHNETERTDYMSELYSNEFLQQWMGTEKDYLRKWQGSQVDPLTKAREICEKLGFIDDKDYQELLSKARQEVEDAHQKALQDPEPSTDEFRNALLDSECKTVNQLAQKYSKEKAGKLVRVTFKEALQRAMREEFAKDPLLIMLGEDIGWPGGGVFEVTTPLLKEDESLRKRIRNSTLDEAAIAGFVAGVGLMGGKAIGEYQFWNFFLSGPSPVLTLAATRPFMSKKAIGGVLRGPVGYAPQSNHYHENWVETYLLKALGIKVVVPSVAEDWYGLFKSAVHDPDLVAFLEEMSTYGWSGEIPKGEYYTPFRPVVRREGKDITLITWGPRMLKLALDTAEILTKESIDLEIIDLRVLNPLDTEFLLGHIAKTGRVIILYEDSKFMGFGAEVAAEIAENMVFYNLQARIIRVAALNTPIPANLTLENYRLPNEKKLIEAARKLMEES